MENAGLGCLSLVDLGAGESRLFCQLELRDCMELSFTAGYAFTHCCVCVDIQPFAQRHFQS